MKKILLITSCVLVAAVIVSMFYMKQGSIVATDAVMVLSTEVSDDVINVQATFQASSLFYTDHEISYRDESLYITIKAVGPFQLPGTTGDPSISIPNTYGSIKAVYLQGSTPEDVKKIWPKDEVKDQLDRSEGSPSAE